MKNQREENQSIRGLQEEEIIERMMIDADFLEWILDEVLPVVSKLGSFVSHYDDPCGYEIQQSFLAICEE